MFNIIKGWFGEKLTTFGMWLRMDESVSGRVDDIILPSANGWTQIDHLLVDLWHFRH